MAIRTNDPYLAQAAANLAQLFAPPSGGDAAGWAAANAKNAEAKRLAELYAQAPDWDRKAVAADLYDPTASFYAQDQNTATTRRGQDITSATALEERRMQEAGLLQRQFASPITAKEGDTVYLPEQTASATGLPRIVAGNINAGKDETITTPDGRVFKGATTPLTADQLSATIIGGQPAASQRAWAMRDVPVENVVGPDGKTPQVAFRPDAVGQQPFIKPTAESQTEITRLIAERDTLPPNDPNRAAYDQRIAALGRGQQQSKYDQVNDEGLAKLNEEIYKNASGALADQNTLTVLSKAVDDPTAAQGTFAGTQLMLRKALNAFGVDAGDTSPMEMINALGNQLALRLRDPSNGAGMPGSLSDSDRQFLLSMSVSLGNSPEANRKLTAFYLRTQEKNIALEQARQQYIAQHGRLDENFRAQAAQLQQRFYAAAQQEAGSGVAPPMNGAAVPRNPTTGAPASGWGSGGAVPPSPPAPPAPPAPPGQILRFDANGNLMQ